jgi:hypothetical protein
MIYSGLDESNNIYRFCKFADIHLDAWQNSGTGPIPTGSSFLDCYQLWLRTNYTASDGKAGVMGGCNEGAVRSSNNTARMVATCHRNVRALYDVVQMYSKKKVTEASYGSMLTMLNKGTLGSSELKLQKMLYAIACCDDNFLVQWTKYCKPGSKEHVERLKERNFDLQNTAQVGQIVKLISERACMPAPKTEHLLCTLLLNLDSFDVIIDGYNIMPYGSSRIGQSAVFKCKRWY